MTKELWEAVREVKMAKRVIVLRDAWSNSQPCDIYGSDPVDTPSTSTQTATPTKKVDNIGGYAYKHVNLIYALNM